MGSDKYKVHIGLDECDSRKRMCTTYIASIIIERLLEERCEFIDYPNLIRLNPGIPWKTRGNGAVALRFLTERPGEVFEISVKVVEEYAEVESDYGLVMYVGDVAEELKLFARRALFDVLSLKEALSLIQKHGMAYRCRGNCRGLIGALAAIGNTLEDDYTFEILAYRARQYWGKKVRHVDEESVIRMDKETRPLTFNNYDFERKRILITPRGPDPVLLGIRGESPEVVLSAFKMVKIDEPVSRYVIFRTNQGTGEHLTNKLDPRKLKAYTTGYLVGRVSSKPRVDVGGHVYFYLNSEGTDVHCAVYEPAGELRKVALKLIPGDLIEVGGEVRRRTTKNPTTLNIEYIKVIELAKQTAFVNPACPRCGKRMKSMGSGQGFRCKKCKYKSKEAKKEEVVIERDLKAGLYLPPPRSMRHLTKPHHRYGLTPKEGVRSLINGWFFVDKQLEA